MNALGLCHPLDFVSPLQVLGYHVHFLLLINTCFIESKRRFNLVNAFLRFLHLKISIGLRCGHQVRSAPGSQSDGSHRNKQKGSKDLGNLLPLWLI